MEDQKITSESSGRSDQDISLEHIVERLEKLEISNRLVARRLSKMRVKSSDEMRNKLFSSKLPGQLSELLFDVPTDAIAAALGDEYAIHTTDSQTEGLVEQHSQKESKPARTNTTKEFWERGDRAIATGSGFAFLGGLFAQLPGALAGAVLGVLFGLFVKSERASQ